MAQRWISGWEFVRFIFFASIAVAMTGGAYSAELRVDAEYPGGNIIVQGREGNTIIVAPDLRDTQTGQWWFYWNFRLRASEETSATIIFTEKNSIGVRGPAMSVDGGKRWAWLGATAVKSLQRNGKPAWSFEALIPEGVGEVRYAFCPQYLESHLRAWLDIYKGDKALRVEELCRSRKGRGVELLRAGCLDPKKSKGVVLLTSRHHCCETMATYAMEGLIGAALVKDQLGTKWRDNWEIIAVPFMDKDGAEDGDQGKNRKPHDHNRDYNATPVYPEVAALMKLGASLQGRILVALDLHCPHIRGEWNDRAYFVGAEQPAVWEKQKAFAAVLERVQQGPIRFRAQDCLPYGTAWNKSSNESQGKSFGAWARESFPNARLVTTMEIAYADALGKDVSATSARELGRDLARALAEYLVDDKPQK
ncbi:MAG: hypothetical protein NTX50_27630 [Candidatus Sumerlaeota bacterium]|nr:hypothetical protein [Candidatus Sumerlaeota bacterium]